MKIICLITIIGGIWYGNEIYKEDVKEWNSHYCPGLYTKPSKFTDILFAMTVLAIATFFIELIFTGVVATVYSQEYSYSFNINALKDNQGIQGQVYYHRGYFSDELSYYFSRDMAEGKMIGHIPASKTYIVENSNVKPNIRCYYEDLKPHSEILDLFLLPITKSGITKYVITVPENTITYSDFEIDLE